MKELRSSVSLCMGKKTKRVCLICESLRKEGLVHEWSFNFSFTKVVYCQ